MNFTGEFLTHFKQKILDETGNLIPTISYKEPNYKYSYKEPYIIKDILKKEEVKEVVIKKISEEELSDLGIVVISIPLTKNQIWRKWQRRAVGLAFKNNIPQGCSKIRLPRAKGGRYHYIEYDIVNKRVRVVGIDAAPSKFGPWLELK